jgi:hypothetical protein
MAEDSEYISDLDPIIELQPTDSFLVETLDGTKRILFRDFILGQDNVDFYNEIAENSTAIVALSSEVLTLSADVATLNIEVASLSSSYIDSTKYGFAYFTLDTSGSLSINAKSSNISSISLTDGGSRVQISTSAVIDFTQAAINLNISPAISASAFTAAFLTSLPLIESRTTGSFKVGRFLTSLTPLSSYSYSGSSTVIRDLEFNIQFRYN